MIESPHNPKIKYARRLAEERRFRQRERRFVVEGIRLVEEALGALGAPAFALVSSELGDSERGRALLHDLGASGAPVLEVTPAAQALASDTVSPQGVVAVFALPELAWPPNPTLLVALDGIQDPGNVGAIARTALAAGVEGALQLAGTADAFNPKSLRGGMGAQFRLPMHSGGWSETAQFAPGVSVAVADALGTTPYTEYDWSLPTLLVIGGEASGASEEALRRASKVVTIPVAPGTESLNAAAAAAVLLFEAVRQRQ